MSLSPCEEEATCQDPDSLFGSCPPPKSKNRRSTMFSFRKNRTLVVSRSPESFTQDSLENAPNDENVRNLSISLSPEKAVVSKPMFIPSPPSSSISFQHRSPANDCTSLRQLSPVSVDADLPSSRPFAQRPAVKLLSPISSLTPPKAEILSGGRCKLPVENSTSELPACGSSPAVVVSSKDASSGNTAVQEKDALITRLKRKVIKMREQRNHHLDMILMCREETESVRFLNAIQELKIEELTSSLSLNTIEKQEALTQRSKKYKQALSKLKQEKDAYEQRANGVIAQLHEQMASLQTMAMERIAVLEKELMAVRRDNEELRTICSRANEVVVDSEERTRPSVDRDELNAHSACWTVAQPDEESRDEYDSEALL
eukprot:gene30587-36960_t